MRDQYGVRSGLCDFDDRSWRYPTGRRKTFLSDDPCSHCSDDILKCTRYMDAIRGRRHKRCECRVPLPRGVTDNSRNLVFRLKAEQKDAISRDTPIRGEGNLRHRVIARNRRDRRY